MQIVLTRIWSSARSADAGHRFGEITFGACFPNGAAVRIVICYALRLPGTARLVLFRKEGRMVFCWLLHGFPGRLLDGLVPAPGGLAPPARDQGGPG
jgi:hypothetical protein